MTAILLPSTTFMPRLRIILLVFLLVCTPLTARQLTLEQALQNATASSLTAHNAKLTLEKQLN